MSSFLSSHLAGLDTSWLLPPQAPRILFVWGSVQTVFFPGLVGAALLHPSFFLPIHLFFLILKVLSKAFEVLGFFPSFYFSVFASCVVIVSAVEQSGPVIRIHVSPLF